MIRFAWLILSRQNDADSIQQRLEVFCKHDATYPLAKEKP
jgi:hypothetical protein